MKLIAIFAFLCYVAYTDSAAVICKFSTSDFYWTLLKSIYSCQVQSTLNLLTRDSAIIDSASPMPSETVKFFYASSRQTHYFPRNLEKVFPGLEAIGFYGCKMKELKKDDIKPFPNLRHIDFRGNDLEVLEEGLFAYNPKLETMLLQNNKISLIDPNVFDQLNNLYQLWLSDNKCINKFASNARDVKSLIAELKSTCNYQQFNNNQRLIALETDNGRLKSELEVIKQGQNEQKAMQTDMNARMSALEAMTQKILELIGNMTMAEEPNMNNRCDGEWSD